MEVFDGKILTSREIVHHCNCEDCEALAPPKRSASKDSASLTSQASFADAETASTVDDLSSQGDNRLEVRGNGFRIPTLRKSSFRAFWYCDVL